MFSLSLLVALCVLLLILLLQNGLLDDSTEDIQAMRCQIEVGSQMCKSGRVELPGQCDAFSAEDIPTSSQCA